MKLLPQFLRLLRWYWFSPRTEAELRAKIHEDIRYMLRMRPTWTVEKWRGRFRAMYFWSWPRP